MTLSLGGLVALTASALTPQRMWLERLALIVPGPAATRWLLVADTVCLIAIALASRHPRLAIPVSLGIGFLILNVIGMLLNDFHLGLALFHYLVATAALVSGGRARWLGRLVLVVALALGVLT